MRLTPAIDPTLAPMGRHVLHVYLPATEPFHSGNLQRGSPEDLKLKTGSSPVSGCGIEVLVQLGNVKHSSSGITWEKPAVGQLGVFDTESSACNGHEHAWSIWSDEQLWWCNTCICSAAISCMLVMNCTCGVPRSAAVLGPWN